MTRYPQFTLGTVLGLGGTGYSIVNGNFEAKSAVSIGTGSFMTYTAFNGTAETIDKMLTFRDSIPEQQEIWEDALEEHRRNGFAARDLTPKEVNQKTLHPLGASHNIAYKTEDGWERLELAENFVELFEKRERKEVTQLLAYNLSHVAPEYMKQAGHNLQNYASNLLK